MKIATRTDLREALLLQVGNDTLSKQRGSFDDVKHLLVVVTQQRELEAIFCGVDSNGSRTS